MVDDVGDFAVVALEAIAQPQERFLVRQVQRQVVELRRLLVRHAGGLRVHVEVLVRVLEERDGVAGPDVEEVVPERRRADRRDQSCAEDAVPEADSGVHVRSDEGEVVDPPPVNGIGAGVHGPQRTPGGKGLKRSGGEAAPKDGSVQTVAQTRTEIFASRLSQTRCHVDLSEVLCDGRRGALDGDVRGPEVVDEGSEFGGALERGEGA